MAHSANILTGAAPERTPTPGRSRNMAAIRSKNTYPELALRKALRQAGLTGYRCHHPSLPGKPDLAYTRWKVAIFVDGAYWHGHPDHFSFGKLGDYWDTKVRRTQQRDQDQQQALLRLGYQVLRFWDFEVKTSAESCAAEVGRLLSRCGRVDQATRLDEQVL